jgi:hypothetical protein
MTKTDNNTIKMHFKIDENSSRFQKLNIKLKIHVSANAFASNIVKETPQRVACISLLLYAYFYFQDQ